MLGVYIVRDDTNGSVRILEEWRLCETSVSKTNQNLKDDNFIPPDVLEVQLLNTSTSPEPFRCKMC